MALPKHKRAAQPEPDVTVTDSHDEPTKEEILQNIRTGMQQALEGQTRPAREALDEIRRKIAVNVDAR